MKIRDPFDNIDKLLGREFDDAPRELKATINLARSAILRHEFIDARSKLQEAQNLLDSKRKELDDWRAEVALAWALYHLSGGPETKPNALWHKIAEAQRLEPDNERLGEIIDLIKVAREQH